MNYASRAAFDAYRTLIGHRLSIEPGEDSEPEFLNRIRLAEETQEFCALAAALSEEYDKPGGLRIVGEWEYRVKNYMRLSEAYSRVRRAAALLLEEEIERFERAIESRQTVVHFLAPLEYLEMDTEGLDFKGFQIRRFAQAELDAITFNEIRRLFYPYAHLDTAILSDYWFIYWYRASGRRGAVFRRDRFFREDIGLLLGLPRTRAGSVPMPRLV